MANGLFPSAGSVRQQILQEHLSEAQMIGLMGEAGRGALVGGIFGRALQGEDPRLRQARALDEINREASAQGLQVGTKAFTDFVVPRIRSRLGFQAGLQAHQMALEAEANVGKVRGGPSPGPLIRAMQQLGVPTPLATDIATDRGLAVKIIEARLKPEKLPDIVRTALFAKQGDQAAARQVVERVLDARAKGQQISVNNYLAKPLGKDAALYQNAQGNSPPGSFTPEQAEAAGFELMDLSEQAAARQRGTFEGRISFLDQEVERTLEEYNAASPANPIDFANKQAALVVALASRANFQGEAADAVARRFNVPGPILGAVLDFFGKRVPTNEEVESLKQQTGGQTQPLEGQTGRRGFRVLKVE